MKNGRGINFTENALKINFFTKIVRQIVELSDFIRSWRVVARFVRHLGAEAWLCRLFHERNQSVVESLTRIETSLKSHHLQRQVRITLLLPPGYYQQGAFYPLLYLNDGQDLTTLHLEQTLARLFHAQQIPPFVVVALHANQDRKMEYGTAARPDFAGRGAKAYLHTRFVLEEVRPFVLDRYRVHPSATHHFFAGFSLGGLSALDIVWHHPDQFSRVGVFSGALWWRSIDVGKGYNEATDRIMHALIREGTFSPELKFWFQTGTEDETNDRNNNGIIDSIEDTLDLITELKNKGYVMNRDIAYLEVQGGKHDQDTWSRALPEFLSWLFGNQSQSYSR